MYSTISSMHMRSFPRLPLELTDLIIDHIASSYDEECDLFVHRNSTLRVCTLVSQMWLPHARKQLFHRVYLNMESPSLDTSLYAEDPDADFKLMWLSPDPPTCQTFLDLFQRSPRKLWVKELVVKDLTPATMQLFREALGCMSGIEVVTFGGGSPFSVPVVFHRARNQLARVRHLRLYASTALSPTSFSSFILHMPRLETLTITFPFDIKLGHMFTFIGHSQPITQKLKRLDISSCPPSLSALILSMFILDNIHTLVLSHNFVPQLPPQLDALRVLEIEHNHQQAISSTLLNSSMSWPQFPFYNAAQVVLHLTYSIELGGYIKELDTLLMRMRLGDHCGRIYIKELCLRISMVESGDDFKNAVWKELDVILDELARYDFKRFHVELPKAAKVDDIRDAMPACRKNGLLTISSFTGQ